MSDVRDPCPTLPADRLYWSVLDAPGWRRAGPLPLALRQPFEEETPQNADELHAVCAPMGDGRVLVCAASKSDMMQADPDALSLTPKTVPEWVSGAPQSSSALNLMVGEFEPRQFRRARVRRHAILMATVLLCGVLVAVGLERRARVWSAAAEHARTRALDLLRENDLSVVPELRARELARLRNAADASMHNTPPSDAAVALAALLRTWPTAIPFKTQAMTVTGTGASTSLTVEGEPSHLLAALAAPPGWKLDKPRIAAAEKLTRITLQFRAVEQGRSP